MMNEPNILPVLSYADIQHAASLIEAAYTPGHTSDQQRLLQQELFEVQKRPEAWGLVIPFLEHENPNVQFFGAHTAQVKIARDWNAIFLDDEGKEKLKDLILDITSKAVAMRRSKIILRKLFVSLSSLALRLVPGNPTKWPEWILSCVTMLSGRGASKEYILDFLAIVAEEIDTSDLIGSSKLQIQQSLLDAVPLVIQALTSSITQLTVSQSELSSAFKCLEPWLSVFRADEVMTFVPILIGLLSSEATFIGASDVLQEALTQTFLSDGSGTKTVTEPLLLYFNGQGSAILQQALASGDMDETSHSLCKLLVALGEHSIVYIAAHISLPLVQNFLRMLLQYTSLPGYYGVDEEESEITLSFWYLLQESLWTVDFIADNTSAEEDQWTIANSLYAELSLILKKKVTWPSQAILSTWGKDQKDKFQVYRRDVGDTLLNAYYVLRDDQLKLYLDELTQLLVNRANGASWEDVEAVLYCVLSVQEAVSISDNQYLKILFSSDILGRLPTTGKYRVRRTTINLIGSYASWFITQKDSTLLLGVVNHVVTALPESWLCLQAADALQKLCDANRTVLAPHVAAFGPLHANIQNIPPTERMKVVESIASVIEALPPDQGIQPTEAIVNPVVRKLAEALNSSSLLPEEARAVAIQQLQILTGCAKGLTGTADALFSLDDEELHDREPLNRAREDPQMIRIRDEIMQSIRRMMELWSSDAMTSDALSELFNSITALPNDMTLISLPPAPLLQLVCAAAQRHLSSVWLSLASKLIYQLNSSVDLFNVKRTNPTPENEAVLLNILPILLQASLTVLNQPNAMEENPDIVQEFFGCMGQVTQHFPSTLFRLPQGAMDALIQASVRALSLQERYSLVAACLFLANLIEHTLRPEPATEEFLAHALALIQTHGESIMQAVLFGLAGAAPVSTNPNLVELLTVIARRCPENCKAWVPKILFSDTFIATQASNEDKEKLMKAIFSGGRAIRRVTQEFILIAKGLSGSGFGYASVTM